MSRKLSDALMRVLLAVEMQKTKKELVEEAETAFEAAERQTALAEKSFLKEIHEFVVEAVRIYNESGPEWCVNEEDFTLSLSVNRFPGDVLLFLCAQTLTDKDGREPERGELNPLHSAEMTKRLREISSQIFKRECIPLMLAEAHGGPYYGSSSS